MDSQFINAKEIDGSDISYAIQCDIRDLPNFLQINDQDTTVVTQNIRSIYSNIHDLQINISMLNFDIDVIILTECWLHPSKNIPIIKEFNLFATTNHLNQNDGVVAYVKKSLSADSREFKLTNASCLQIELENSIIIGIYRSPSNSNADAFISSLNSHLENLKTHKNIILTGDININIISRITEQTFERNNRSSYLNMLSTHGFLPGHVLPTREANCLDHFFLRINKNNVLSHVAVLNTTITDHSMIILNLKNSISTNRASKTRTVTNYNHSLKTLAEKNLSDLLFCDDPNIVVQLLTSKITESLQENTKIVNIPRNKRILKPWITTGVLRCIRNRNKMQKELKQNPHNEILKISFKRYRNYCNNLIKKLKIQYDREQLTTSTNSKILWQNIKKVTNISRTKTDNTALLSIKPVPNESVNYINNYFANIGKILAWEITSTGIPRNYIPDTSSYSHLSSFVLLGTSVDEINSVLTGLKSTSSAGWDKIPTIFLKMARSEVAPIICHLTNLCFETGNFPSPLKQAIITPIHKSGDRNDVNNYRPISVLSAISKVLEKCLNKRLVNYLDKYKLISESQFGFRRGKSTEDAVSSLSSLIVEHVDQRKKCVCVFLDLKKAFDTVSVTSLVKKLELIGIRGIPLKLFQNYLEQRKQRVKVGEYVSDETDITYGVPQGSVLGPTLFLVYINELCSMKLKNGQVFSYADDTAIVFSGHSWKDVQRSSEEGLAKVSYWLNANSLTLNTNKTNYVCFSIKNNTQPNNDFNIKIHDCGNHKSQNCSCPIIDKVVYTKYLGVILDQNLSWYPQLELVANRVRKLTWIFKKLRHVAPTDLLNKIYIILAQSIITYCIPIWGGAAKTRYIEVERAQRHLLKIMHFKPYHHPTNLLYSTSNVLTVRQLYILHTTLKLHKTLRCDPNILKKRTHRFVAPSVFTKSVFASVQFKKQSCLLYNRISKVLHIITSQQYECKNKLTSWLKLLSYEQTEALLNVVK